MNDYTKLAQEIVNRLGGSVSGPLGTYTSEDLKKLRKYLKTAPGREAARGAIDNVVVKSKNPMMAPSLIAHDDIMRALVFSMNSAQVPVYNEEALSANPMNVQEGYTGPKY